MQTDSYPHPFVRLSQAFEPEKFSGGASGSEITRRSFLKRTGGATVATLVAWNLANQTAKARVDIDSTSGDPTSEEPNWQIRVDKVEKEHETIGSEYEWTDPLNNTIYVVARCLKLTVKAPQDPGAVGEFTFGPEATSVMTVTIKTSARYVIKPKPSGFEWKKAPEMGLNQLNRLLGKSAPTAETEVEVWKHIDKLTGEIDGSEYMVSGEVVGSPDYDESYVEPGTGITITFEWLGGDLLKVGFMSDLVLNPNDMIFEPVFVRRNYGAPN